MGLNASQLRELIVRPTLQAVGLHSDAAEDLVMGTAAQESRLTYLKQLGTGPALGLFQVEPATYADYHQWLNKRPELRTRIARYCCGHQMLEIPTGATSVVHNLRLAAVMCRVHYRRIKAPLPDHGDIEGYANYWKKYYNTHLGAGTPDEFIRHYQLVDTKKPR